MMFRRGAKVDFAVIAFSVRQKIQLRSNDVDCEEKV
jgi:hypothetical protein